MGPITSLPRKFYHRFSELLPRARHIMPFSIALLLLSSAASALGQDGPVPVPKIANVTYWGSACPDGGLQAFIGPVNTTTNIAPLTFTLANFLPAMGSFGSSLRMCNIISHITIDNGWKIMVNAQGTNAQGNTDLPSNATMFLRSTYSFAEKAEIQVRVTSLLQLLSKY